MLFPDLFFLSFLFFFFLFKIYYLFIYFCDVKEQHMHVGQDRSRLQWRHYKHSEIMSMAGRNTLTFSVYRLDPPVKFCYRLQYQHIKSKFSKSRVWRRLDGETYPLRHMKLDLPVWWIYFTFLFYSFSVAQIHSSEYIFSSEYLFSFYVSLLWVNVKDE